MTDLDRRKFLLQAGGSLGGFLASPRLGLVAAVGGALAASESSQSGEESLPVASQAALPLPRLDRQAKTRILLRSAEPINARGEPFGFSMSGMASVVLPSAPHEERLALVIGHEHERPECEDRFKRKSVGISLIELVKSGRGSGWRHDVASYRNKRWDLDSEIPLDGARFDENGKIIRHQEARTGVLPIASVALTPWGTVLCAERSGYLVEVNPLTGVAIKRFSLGSVSARSIVVSANAGQPARAYLLGRALYRFTSHQRFEARQLQANSQILSIGELEVADLGETRWISFTKDLSHARWLAKLNVLDASVESSLCIDSPQSLQRGHEGHSIVLTTGSRRYEIFDGGPAFACHGRQLQDGEAELASRAPLERIFKMGAFFAENKHDGAELSVF